MDEDTIDEIFTINENNQFRMHNLVNHYFDNVHYEHSWAEIVQVLKNIGENKTADKITKDKFLGESVVVKVVVGLGETVLAKTTQAVFIT